MKASAPRRGLDPLETRAGMRLVKRETVYRGRVIELVRDTLAVGGERIVRETVRHPGSVVIVPVLPDRRILFIRQYRRAIGKPLVELPAGTLGHGENRLLCAKRELEEETGWRAARWRKLGEFYPAPGFLSEYMTIFLAQQLTPSAAHPEPDEVITPLPMTLTTALRRIRSGSICDAKSIIGIWLANARLDAE